MKRMLSTAFALAWILATPLAAGEPEPAPLALHPENPRYFLFRERPTVLITSGEHYGAVLNLDFDYVRYLNELQAQGLNHTRTWVGTYREIAGSFNIAENTLAPAPNRYLCPWARSTTPGYFDAGNKFDLTRWDPDYFQRLKDFLTQASRRGVVVEMNLFCPNYDDKLWRANPMNAANNVNGVGKCPANEVYTLKHGDLLAVQEAVTRKIVQELREFDNLYYEVCNEPYFGGVTMEWQHRIVDVIVDAEKQFPHKHLISLNVANGRARVDKPHPAVSLFNFHYCHPPDVVAMNAHLHKPIGENETGFRGKADALYRSEGWDFMLAGGALYNNLDYSFTVQHPDGSRLDANAPGGGSPTLRRQLKVLKDFLNSFEFLRMAPDNSVLKGALPPKATTRALVEPGRQYAVYVHGGTQVDLQLELPAGSYAVQWLNPTTGKTHRSETLKHSGGAATLRSPVYTEDIALGVVNTEREFSFAGWSWYRAVNLGGPPLVIDGQAWEGEDAPHLSFTGKSFENQGVALNPDPGADRARMIRSSVWDPRGSNLKLTQVPPGTYQVFLYVWEDNFSQTFDILLNETRVQQGHASGPGGHWDKLGPWIVNVTDGTIGLRCSPGDANLSGIEVWRKPAAVAAPKVPAKPPTGRTVP